MVLANDLSIVPFVYLLAPSASYLIALVELLPALVVIARTSVYAINKILSMSGMQ